jgi:hypothetical protein
VTEPTAPPEGWYPDPAGGGGLRWWTGVTWTSDTRTTAPVAPTAPLPMAPVATGPSTVWSPVVPEPDDEASPVLASRHSRRTRWVAAAVVVLLLGVLGAGAVVAASLATRNRLDIGAVENEIAAQITASSGLHTTVVCPGPIDIAAGTTFTCQATTDDGVSTVVTVHQDDDQGNLTFGLPQ